MSSISDTQTVVLPDTLTLETVVDHIASLHPVYPVLTTVSAAQLKQYDSAVFAYLLAVMRRAPVCLDAQCLYCVYFPEALQLLLKSYGLETILRCLPMPSGVVS